MEVADSVRALLCNVPRGASIKLTDKSHPDGGDQVVQAIRADGREAVVLELDVAGTASFPASKDAVAVAIDAKRRRTDFDRVSTDD